MDDSFFNHENRLGVRCLSGSSSTLGEGQGKKRMMLLEPEARVLTWLLCPPAPCHSGTTSLPPRQPERFLFQGFLVPGAKLAVRSSSTRRALANQGESPPGFLLPWSTPIACPRRPPDLPNTWPGSCCSQLLPQGLRINSLCSLQGSTHRVAR